MKDIKYTTGASNLGGSLAGMSDAALSTGFEDATPQRRSPFDPDFVREDDGGTNSVGSLYDFTKTGACGRPQGFER